MPVFKKTRDSSAMTHSSLRDRLPDSFPLSFFILFIILICNMIFWGSKKEGYYIDELYSYGLANSYYMPFLQEQDSYMEQWHDSDFYRDYLTVSGKETAFSYSSVYDNQAHDVHPPLYYILLHTICSLFQREFSKWFGLSVNLFFFAGTILLLYAIGGCILGRSSRIRLIPCVLYGFGAGISITIYIRMYAMLVFWGLLFVYLIFRLMEENKLKILIGITVTTIGGFLTQYYFLIFAFFISCGYMLFRLFQRQWKAALAFAVSAFAGIGIGVLFFPASLSHIFLNSKGQEAYGNIFREDQIFLKWSKQYLELIAQSFFFSKKGLKVFFICLFLLVMAAILIDLCKKQWKENIFSLAGIQFWILAVSAAAYFSTVVQISSGIAGRYLFLIYPLIVLLVVSASCYALKNLRIERAIWLMAFSYVLFALQHYSGDYINYIYPGYGKTLLALSTTYRDSPGIYVTMGDYLIVSNSLFLMQQEQTYPISPENLEKLPEICKGKETGQLILYVDTYFSEEEIAKQAMAQMGYTSYVLLYDNIDSKIFCLLQ